MYIDFAGREIEDLEMDNMRRDARAEKIEVYFTRKTLGCFGVDAQGNPWGTFGIEGAGGDPEQCASCGKDIREGWAKGKLGEQEYYCCEHISYQRKEGE